MLVVEHTVVDVGGEVDLAAAPQLHRLLADAIERAPLVVVDLSAVTLLDPAGFGVLAGGLLMARLRGGDLRVAAPPGPARRAFEITGTTTVFAVADTVSAHTSP